MQRVINEVRRDLSDLSRDAYCGDAAALAIDALDLLTPPEDISTTECAQRYRKVRATEGGGYINWSLELTPYLKGPQDALDAINVTEVIMPKPGRTGGTMAFENFLFKRLRFGPMTDVGWYLGGPDEVKSYCDKQVTPLFEDHPEISAKIGSGKSDNNITRKRVAGRFLEYLAASNKTITGRQFGLMVGDEIDTFPKRIRASFLQQSRVRGRALGNRRKVGMTSHPDAGWTDGIAAAWIDSSRGIYVWPCAECHFWSSPWPTSYWPDVARTELHYVRLPDAGRDERIAKAVETASMQCPHCGALLNDEQRKSMSLIGEWLHRGQTLDVSAGPMGDVESNPSMGFWIHGLMSMMVTNAELARDLETATIVYERTKKVEQLREVIAKVFGQVFEGPAGSAETTSADLQKRAKGENALQIGECPAEALFITAAVDVGAGKFDVSFYGWDLEGRSWLLDRLTIRQRMWPDGRLRDIRTRERVEDWDVLSDQVILRTFPICGQDGMAMPVAAVAIDVSDGNAVWKGREFARRSLRAGHYWGKPEQPWARVKLIQGSPSPKAPALSGARKIDKDEEGHPVRPVVQEYTLGVHELKQLIHERLTVTDGGPGQCHFANGIGGNYFEEFFNERLIDGKWVRNGPNESLDLAGYAEAVRLMLRPDRKDIKWDKGQRPPWAAPVPVNMGGGDLAVADEDHIIAEPPARPTPAATKPSFFVRYEQLNRSEE